LVIEPLSEAPGPAKLRAQESPERGAVGEGAGFIHCIIRRGGSGAAGGSAPGLFGQGGAT